MRATTVVVIAALLSVAVLAVLDVVLHAPPYADAVAIAVVVFFVSVASNRDGGE